MKENPFFTGIRRTGWVRPEDRWIGGVCAELARKSGWDVSLIRGLVVIATLVFWFPLALYGAAWFLLPDARNGEILAEELMRGRFQGAQVGAIIAIIVGVTNPMPPFGWHFWTLGVITVAIIAAVILISQNRNNKTSHQAQKGPDQMSTPPVPPPSPATPPHPQPQPRPTANTAPYQGAYTYAPVPPRPYSQPPTQQSKPISSAVGLAVLGVLFLLGSALVLAHVTGWPALNAFVGVGWAIWAAAALIIMGVVLAVGALRGRRGGWFLGFSIVAAMVLFPIGAGSAAVVNRHFYDLPFTAFGYNFNEAGVIYADHTDSEIDADASSVTLDLSNAPKNYDHDIHVDLDASNLTVITRKDQPISLTLDGSISNFSSQKQGVPIWGNDAPSRLAGFFTWSGESPTYDGTGIRLEIDMDASNVDWQVVDKHTPEISQSEGHN